MSVSDKYPIPDFTRGTWESGEIISRIGAGQIGGKGSGLVLLAREFLAGIDHEDFPEFRITIPRLVADYLQARLWSRGDDLSLIHLDVRINSETPEKGLNLLWRSGMFHLPPENAAGAGERVTIVRV